MQTWRRRRRKGRAKGFTLQFSSLKGTGVGTSLDKVFRFTRYIYVCLKNRISKIALLYQLLIARKT